MTDGPPETTDPDSSAEAVLSREFPTLHAFYAANSILRPNRPEIWDRILRVARNSKPILDELRARGLDILRLEHYTPPGTDRRPIYVTVLEWLHRVQDPLTLSICLHRLIEPGARPLVKKNRELLLRLAQEWNERLAGNDSERTLSVLAQCVMRAAQERDVLQVLSWASDRRLPTGARASYVIDLQRFARKPGRARDGLLAFVADADVGSPAVWALAGAMKGEALPLLHELRKSSPHESVREAAAFIAKKLEARSRRLELPEADAAVLPNDFESTSIEFDTDRVPELVSVVEEEMKALLPQRVADQLALSAVQLKRGRHRFHIVPFTLPSGARSQLGFRVTAEDEDTVIVELHFDPTLRGAIERALNRLLENDERKTK
jgi:hypothetical protein